LAAAIGGLGRATATAYVVSVSMAGMNRAPTLDGVIVGHQRQRGLWWASARNPHPFNNSSRTSGHYYEAANAKHPSSVIARRQDLNGQYILRWATSADDITFMPSFQSYQVDRQLAHQPWVCRHE
jgi:hypothetical protein